MKLSKKVIANIEREAKRIKEIYEAPNPEVDKVIAELREEAEKRPKNLTREQKIAWILDGTDNKVLDWEIENLK